MSGSLRPMPDRRQHRGPHPEDASLFADGWVATLRTATRDLSWLLSRGYPDVAATKLVGDRYRLAQRQRVAVRRCACSDAQRTARRSARVALGALAGAAVVVDGFNVLTTIEAALAGGVVLLARDGCRRDLASMHGSWKRVQETETATTILLELLAAAAPARTTIVLDRPVANSGRLATSIRAAARTRLPACSVELHDGADRALLAADAVIATADSGVLDRAARWVDLSTPALARLQPPPWLLDLRR